MSAKTDDRPLIALVDYGMGNLLSVSHGLRRAGAAVEFAAGPDGLRSAAAVVLPGVGAFAAGMRNLEERGLLDPLREAALSPRPFLAICLGMQLLFDESEEGGTNRGMGVLHGHVARLPKGVKVPQMGWNTVSRTEAAARSPYDRVLGEGEYYYFAHSYCVRADDPADVLATTEYGSRFASAVGRGPLLGTQFHPEKSSAAGLEILTRFVAIAREGAAC